MQATVPELDFLKYWLVLKRRRLVVALVFIPVTGLATVAALMQKPAYEVSAKLLIKSDRSSALTGLNVKIGELETLGTSPQKDPIITQAETVKSVPIFQKVLKAVPSPAGKKPLTVEYLLKNLKVKPVAGTDVLQISYKSKDQQHAIALVSAVVDEYIKSNFDLNRQQAKTAREFIDRQLPQTEAAVSKAEMALRQFKERNNIIALEQESTQMISNMGTLKTQLDQAKAALADADARSTRLRNQLGMSPEVAIDQSSLGQSPGVQDALTKLNAVQAQLTLERARYRDNHPTMMDLRRQEADLRSLLQRRVSAVSSRATIDRSPQSAIGGLELGDLKKNLTTSYLQSQVERDGLAQKVAELSALQSTYRSRSSALPGLEKTQHELQRQLKAAQATYEALLAKLQEIKVAENQNVGNVNVIEAANVPKQPDQSQKMLILTAGLMAGLLLGVAAAFGVDLLAQPKRLAPAGPLVHKQHGS
jgi:polysaccharide biosynthesis transport protein